MASQAARDASEDALDGLIEKLQDGINTLPEEAAPPARCDTFDKAFLAEAAQCSLSALEYMYEYCACPHDSTATKPPVQVQVYCTCNLSSWQRSIEKRYLQCNERNVTGRAALTFRACH